MNINQQRPNINNLRNYRLHIVLDNIRSAYNVGSIFRTADATGSSMIHICGISPAPPNTKLQKTALGALESVPWRQYDNTIQSLKILKKLMIPVFSVEISPQSQIYTQIEYPNPVALVLGHEINGISQKVLDISDKIIQIEMKGVKGSLNVATAAGIVMFEAIRNSDII
ncbi:TrmH family RNA methyltransferase [Candidatus Dojkabacteria bacterium]|nr:TrmH family RNA methyltransferase [Candidatus Dojkabacteria bacterium]